MTLAQVCVGRQRRLHHSFYGALKHREEKVLQQRPVEKKSRKAENKTPTLEKGIWKVNSIKTQEGGTWSGVEPETGGPTDGPFLVGVAKCSNGVGERDVEFATHPPRVYELPIQLGDRFRFVSEAHFLTNLWKSNLIALLELMSTLFMSKY